MLGSNGKACQRRQPPLRARRPRMPARPLCAAAAISTAHDTIPAGHRAGAWTTGWRPAMWMSPPVAVSVHSHGDGRVVLNR
jgi:hypothetical protein